MEKAPGYATVQIGLYAVRAAQLTGENIGECVQLSFPESCLSLWMDRAEVAYLLFGLDEDA